METYWRYRTRVHSFRKQPVMARLVRGSVKNPFQSEPYGIDLQPVFVVNSQWRHPDNHHNDFGFDLFSRRLLDLMREFGVKHESFLATMTDKAGNYLFDLEYYVFHPLGDMFEPGPLMVDDKTYKLLMRNDMMEQILHRGISGYEFLSQV